jgi:cytochrome bd ubiquinol oxidase subunit I
MDTVLLARWQFAITCVYHFFFVPLTLGLVWVVAGLHTAWYTTGQEVWKKLTLFWGRLFLINFAMGVVTGIVMEFQFGMNWSEYARFVGDIFGAPLAIEALLAFFLESTFLGLWVFGWDKLPKKIHVACIWLVAIGSNLSALWILIANSFMQEPMGYALRNGRAEMTDFWALVFNPHVFVQFPHVLTGAMCTAAFFMLGISAWHLRRAADDENRDAFRRSFTIGAVYALVASLAVAGIGHRQAQYMVQAQPMKMAAAEALWDTANPAPLSLFTWFNEAERRDVFAIKIPGGLSMLAHNTFNAEVKGIKEIQAEYEQKYGPGDYTPPIKWTYWSFRGMVAAGSAMVLLAAWAVFAGRKRDTTFPRLLLVILPPAMALPYIAHSTGWILTEMGRSPWIVFGLQKIADAVSPAVSPGELLLTLIGFTLLYGVLMVVDVYLLVKFARLGVTNVSLHGGEASAEPARV